MKLFVERALEVQPNFSVTKANASAIAQICFRLDGIPLAIELAAARVKLFSPQEIAERLDDRFRLLTAGSRTALPRQQTLRAAMDWSYSLLSEKEKILFRRLAVFVGGCTFDAAEQVCAVQVTQARALNSDSPEPGLDILELLAQLVNKSLVTTEGRGEETRYRMLETIREYAFEKLNVAGETDSLRDKHLDFLISFAEEAEPQLKRAQQEEWLERLDADVDNFRAALGWSQEHGRPEKGLRLATALARFWEMRSDRTEAIRHLEDLLRDPGVAAKTFEIARELGGRQLSLAICINFGFVALYDGDLQLAKQQFEQALMFSQELNDSIGAAMALMGLGSLVAVQKRGVVAVRLLSFGDHIVHSNPQSAATSVDEQEFNRYLAVARSHLTEQEFDAAWKEGRALTLEQAIELALSI